MKKTIFIGIISLISSLAQAQSFYYDQEALKICDRQTYDWLKIECLKQIENQQYDSLVIDICNKQTYQDDAPTICLAKIANKKFLNPVEVQFCREQTYDFAQVECLESISTTQMSPL